MTEVEDSLLWLNGCLLPARLVRIDPADRRLTLGDGLFETIRVAGGMPRLTKLHLAMIAARCGFVGHRGATR